MKSSFVKGLCLVSLLAICAVSDVCGQKHFSTVVIDPGHGGKDPGAIGSKYREKNLVLDIALKLGRMLNDSMPAVNVVYTRKKDVFIPLDKRAEIANKNNADLFVSIHANSTKAKGIFGAETFVLGLHRSKENLEVAQKENSVITLEDEYTSKYEGFDPSQPESYIIFELMQNVYLDQSITVASEIQSSFAKADRADRGVKQAGFLVLRQTSMPGVLVELGFISDPAEEAFMASAEGSMKLVTSLYNAIKHYRDAYDGKNVAIKNNKEEKKNVEKINLWPSGINFRVQVVVSAEEKDITVATGEPVSMLKENDKYKYMVGILKTPEDANALRNKLKDKYPDCFVVAFDGKEKTSVRVAKKKINKD